MQQESFCRKLTQAENGFPWDFAKAQFQLFVFVLACSPCRGLDCHRRGIRGEFYAQSPHFS